MTGGIPLVDVLTKLTDEELTLLSLAVFRNLCKKQADNKMLKIHSREDYVKISRRLDAILDMRGATTDGKTQKTESNSTDN